jgi:hypothetical protein
MSSDLAVVAQLHHDQGSGVVASVVGGRDGFITGYACPGITPLTSQQLKVRLTTADKSSLSLNLSQIKHASFPLPVS